MKKVFTKAWGVAALVRAIKTWAQGFIAAVPTTAVTLGQVNWMIAISTACVAAVLSLATSLAGLPEVPAEEE